MSFADHASDDIFNGKHSKQARQRLPSQLWRIAQRKLDQLNCVATLDDFRISSGNMLEALRGDRAGNYSIRINDQYRICFAWTADGPAGVIVIDYH